MAMKQRFRQSIAYKLSGKTILTFTLLLVALDGNSQTNYVAIQDTRAINDSPTFFKSRLNLDFKNRNLIGAPGDGTYTAVLTVAPWGDNSGGKNHQLGFNNGGIFYRMGDHLLPTWESWRKLVIEDANGNVGVGTNTPSAILHVNPALDAASAIKIGAPYTQGNTNVPLKGSPGGYNIDFYTWRDVQADQIGARIRAERINNYDLNNAMVQAMDLTFATSLGYVGTLSEKMRINSLGNVGIGTAFPAEKLSVNGKIRAHEIKVELTGWSDFVFAKDYILPTLQETEQHIKEKGHLPGIPSAAEVEKNGIELGDMNKKLLQKIEELTLYLIEMKKESERQSKEIQDLKTKQNHN
jgi:hypothetical protein